MKSKEQLLEQYDDLLFTALMERVAEKEGARLMEENAKLRADPSMDIPAESYQRGLQAINRAFAAHARRSGARVAGRVLRNIAVAVLVITLITAVSFAAFPELRAHVINTFLDIYETHTDFSFGETSFEAGDLTLDIKWLPDGFKLKEEGSTHNEEWKIYWDGADAYIILEKSTPITQSVDTENARIERISIQDFDGTLILKDDMVDIVWLNTISHTVYSVMAQQVDVEDVITIGENLF